MQNSRSQDISSRSEIKMSLDFSLFILMQDITGSNSSETLLKIFFGISKQNQKMQNSRSQDLFPQVLRGHLSPSFHCCCRRCPQCMVGYTQSNRTQKRALKSPFYRALPQNGNYKVANGILSGNAPLRDLRLECAYQRTCVARENQRIVS